MIYVIIYNSFVFRYLCKPSEILAFEDMLLCYGFAHFCWLRLLSKMLYMIYMIASILLTQKAMEPK